MRNMEKIGFSKNEAPIHGVLLCLEGENGEVGGQLPHLQGKMEGANPHKTFNLSKVG